ncbi:MAG: RNA methyltransferase [Spirochaetales bacterium]|nr:RNA methyltransferase [Spirochaetales bacterium]
MKNTIRNELAVCGRAAVQALAERHPERIARLYIHRDRAREFGELCSRMAADKKPYNVVAEADLEKLSDTVHHQGVVAMIEPPRIEPVDARLVEAWARAGEKVVALDGIGNALNLGAVVRSMAFFGIRTLVVSDDDKDAKPTTSAYRVAQGGMELVRIHRTQTAAAFARIAEGKLIRVGADHRGKIGAGVLSAQLGAGQGVALFLGNEEEGLSPAVRQLMDKLVSIPGSGEVESLNVAQAATVFCWELAGRKSDGNR